jgi:serine O-acetyltransferase
MNTLNRIKSDAYRYSASMAWNNMIYLYLKSSGFRYTVWLRIAHGFRSNKFLYILPWFVLSKLKYKYGYDIPAETTIAEGFYIGHFGNVVISSKATIKKNCNISHGVTIGYKAGNLNNGYPIIGENVYIGPGAKIFGGITVGNNVAIGANAVVNKDIPDNCTVAGVPAQIVSQSGSFELILNKIP